MKPLENEYGAYYERYVAMVKSDNMSQALMNSVTFSDEFWSSIPEELGNYRYAEGKWSVKELLQHIIDTERIFSYRALAIARGESIALPGYAENAYADNCFADSRTLQSLADELRVVRQSSIHLFKSFAEERLEMIGTASNSPLSPRAAGFILVGHEIHHINVVKERYLAHYQNLKS